MNLFSRINRSFYNSLVHSVMCRMHERGIINSTQLHEILGEWNRRCWADRGYGRASVVVQKNCTVGGDIAGGDIIK